MTNWQTKNLGEVCEVVNGGTPKTNIEKYWDGDILWMTPKDMGKIKSFYASDTLRKITKQGLKNSSAKVIPENSVILSTRAPIGHLVINSQEMSFNQGCKGLIAKNDLDIKYLFYFLFNSVDLLNKLGSGTTFKELSSAKLKQIQIPLPPLPEQRRIVKILDGVFGGVEKAKENAEKNLANAKELFENYLQDIYTNNSRGWKIKKLSDVAEYFNGLTYSPKDVVDNRGNIVLRSSNIQNDELDFLDIVRVNRPIKDKIIVRDGDILMCSRNGSKRLIGKTAVIKNLKEKMTFGTFMMVIRSQQNPYLIWFFKSNEFRKQISKGENTAINQITRYMLDDVLISFPPVEKQKAIVKKFDALSGETKKLEGIYRQKLADLEELKKALLQQAFAGKL